MISKIKSKTLQDLLKVFSGNIVAQGIGFLTIIIISRDLGVEQYGIYSLLLAIFTISIQVSDFGISTSYVKYLSENLSKAKEIFFTVIISKILLSFIVTGILFFLSASLSYFFFETYKYASVIKLISFSILFHSIFSVIIAHYQANQKFKEFAYLNIFHNILKIVSIVFVSIYFIQNEHLDYFLYGYFFSVVLILLYMLTTNYKKIYDIKSFKIIHFIEIYKLGFWIFLSTLATMVIMRLDIMMLQKMSTSQEVGYYSVAMNLAMIFPLITTSLTTTLLPKLDGYLKDNTIKDYIFKVLSNAKYIVVLLIVFEFISPYIITLLFGSEYGNSIHVFQILLIAFIFGVIINPIAIVIYSIDKAYILTILNWIQLPMNYFGNILLIPLLQAEGAALSTVVLRIFGGLYIIFYLVKVKNDK